jgi:hypothetical protein
MPAQGRSLGKCKALPLTLAEIAPGPTHIGAPDGPGPISKLLKQVNHSALHLQGLPVASAKRSLGYMAILHDYIYNY